MSIVICIYAGLDAVTSAKKKKRKGSSVFGIPLKTLEGYMLLGMLLTLIVCRRGGRRVKL